MAFSAVPTGTILPFGGSSSPSGWLLCNGASVAIASYPALNNAIGVLWGNPGGGSFNLPDLTGSFVRGIGTSGVHVGPATVGAVQAHATSANGLGGTATGQTYSGSSVSTPNGGHTHGLMYAPGAGLATGPYGYVLTNTGSDITNAGNHDHSTAISHTHAASGLNITGSTETRPNSKGVNYIIKI